MHTSEITRRKAANLADRAHDTVECECCGSGLYFGHGYVENDVFRGFVGKCFRCGGKGYQNPADVKRNNYYDNHVRRFDV